MKILSVRIFKDGEIIRDVNNIKYGINIITNTEDEKNPNDIGKSSILKVIDYCLWSSWGDLVNDPETWNPNELVQNFLIGSDTRFELRFIVDSTEYTIVRKYGTTEHLSINWKHFTSEEEFKLKLNYIIFWILDDEFKLRNLIPFFIRKNDQWMGNIVKYLYQFIGHSKLAQAYTVLLGFNQYELLNQKIDKTEEKSTIMERIKSYHWVTTIKDLPSIREKIQYSVDQVDIKIEALKIKRDDFDFIDAWQSEIKKMNSFKEEIYDLRSSISKAELKEKFNTNYIKRLKREINNMDVEEIKLLYKDAEDNLNKLHKTFQDVTEFHSRLLVNKIEYLNGENKKLKLRIKEDKIKLNSLEVEESNLTKSFVDKGILSDYRRIDNDVAELKVKKGIEIDKIKDIDHSESTINRLTLEIRELNKKLKEYMWTFQDSIDSFNIILKEVSWKTLDKELSLSIDIGKTFIPKIKGASANPWPWEKAKEIITFMFAYIQYSEKLWINYCNTLTFDFIDQVWPESLKKIFNYASSLQACIIIPILRNNIPDIAKQNIILELSQTNKLYKI